MRTATVRIVVFLCKAMDMCGGLICGHVHALQPLPEPKSNKKDKDAHLTTMLAVNQLTSGHAHILRPLPVPSQTTIIHKTATHTKQRCTLQTNSPVATFTYCGRCQVTTGGVAPGGPPADALSRAACSSRFPAVHAEYHTKPVEAYSCS